MPWAAFDDEFWINPKLQRLSDKAHRLYVRAIGYSAKYMTDGVVDTTALHTLAATRKVCDELVAAGCWQPVPDGGYQIHDYLDFNPTRQQVLDKRQKAAERQARKRGHANKDPDTGRFTT